MKKLKNTGVKKNTLQTNHQDLSTTFIRGSCNIVKVVIREEDNSDFQSAFLDFFSHCCIWSAKLFLKKLKPEF